MRSHREPSLRVLSGPTSVLEHNCALLRLIHCVEVSWKWRLPSSIPPSFCDCRKAQRDWWLEQLPWRAVILPKLDRYLSDSGNDRAFLWVTYHSASNWGDRAGLNESCQLSWLSLDCIPKLKMSCIIMRVKIHMLCCEKWVMVQDLDIWKLAVWVGDYTPKRYSIGFKTSRVVRARSNIAILSCQFLQRRSCPAESVARSTLKC